MKKKLSHILFITLGLAISAIALFYVFEGVDYELFFSEFNNVSLWCLPALFVVMVLTFLARAYRWKYLLPQNDTNLETKALYDATCIGFLASIILPLRAGEIIRPYALSKVQNVSFTVAFASIVTERVFDIVTMFALLGLCLLSFDTLPDIVLSGSRVLLAMTVVLVAVMLVAYVYPKIFLSISSYLKSRFVGNSFVDKITDIGEEFLLGLKSISTFKDLLIVCLMSAVVWMLMALNFQILLWAFGLDVGIMAGITIVVFVALAVAAPSAPGFLGTFQAGCVIALSVVYSFTQEFALAFSIINHLIQIVAILILGVHSLTRTGLQLKKLASESQGAD